MEQTMDDIVVLKLNLAREETWRYSGKVMARTGHSILLQAFFNRNDSPFHEITLKRGDLFIEIYYSDRWYNIYEIYDRDDGQIKGWYCNVCLPAELSEAEIRYVDLALDLLVYPDGRQIRLDEDEFEALELDPDVHKRALEALQELESVVKPGAGYHLKPGEESQTPPLHP